MTTQYLIDTLNPTELPQVMNELQNGTVTRTYADDKRRGDAKPLLRKAGEWLGEVFSAEPLYEMLGPTLGAAADFFTFTFCVSVLAASAARSWQGSNGATVLAAVTESPIRFLLCLALVVVWIYGLARYFRVMRWPWWWAAACVLLVLCPSAWEVAHRIEPGGDFMALLLLQSPITVAYVLRVRSLTRRKGAS